MKRCPWIPLFLGACILAVTPVRGATPLRVVAYEQEPYFYREGGRPAGVEFEILEYFERTSGRTLEIQWVETFEEALPVLERGESDLAAGTITITPEREQRFDFSSPYLPVRVMLVEPRGVGTSSLEQLRGATVASIRGTTYESLLAGIPGVEIVYAENEEAQFELVAAGRASALAVDSAVAFALLPRYPGLQLGMPLTEEQGFGFAVPKASPLAEELSRHIRRLKESKIYFRILETYLGEDALRVVKSARGR